MAWVRSSRMASRRTVHVRACQNARGQGGGVGGPRPTVGEPAAWCGPVLAGNAETPPVSRVRDGQNLEVGPGAAAIGRGYEVVAVPAVRLEACAAAVDDDRGCAGRASQIERTNVDRQTHGGDSRPGLAAVRCLLEDATAGPHPGDRTERAGVPASGYRDPLGAESGAAIVTDQQHERTRVAVRSADRDRNLDVRTDQQRCVRRVVWGPRQAGHFGFGPGGPAV